MFSNSRPEDSNHQTSGGLFGGGVSTTSPNVSGGGLFGGAIFGGAAPANYSQFPHSNPSGQSAPKPPQNNVSPNQGVSSSGGGLFGSTAQANQHHTLNNNGTSSFGTSQPQGGLFCSPQPQGNLFGGTGTTGSGSLFGTTTGRSLFSRGEDTITIPFANRSYTITFQISDPPAAPKPQSAGRQPPDQANPGKKYITLTVYVFDEPVNITICTNCLVAELVRRAIDACSDLSEKDINGLVEKGELTLQDTDKKISFLKAIKEVPEITSGCNLELTFKD